MKNTFIIVCLLTLLSLAGCIGKGSHSNEKSMTSRPSDTLYTEKAAMSIYATQPERALQIIYSAKIVGNLTDVKAELLRAIVYSRTIESMQYDSAILIAERLMHNDIVLANNALKEDVLEVLLNACRLNQDFEQALYWATQLRDSYQEDGKGIETLRIDAEIGTLLVNVGQEEEGMAKIDSVIQQLELRSEPKSFKNLDASIIVLKRKVEACFDMELYDTVIPTAHRMLDLLSDYEQHPDDFHDGYYREPTEAKRPQYIDFYRGKAYGYMAKSYASLHEKDEAEKYIALFDQSYTNQSITSRFMIAPTLGKIGEYEHMLAIYDEVEAQMGNDTLNEYYAEILQERAKAAEAQNRFADANHYLQRYNKLKELLYKDQMQSKANLYAARFQSQEQQREIERQREATRRAKESRGVIGFVSLLILLFAIYVFWQWRKTNKQNRILAQQIRDAVEYKEKYRELSTQNAKLSTDSKLSTLNSTLSDAELSAYLCNLIENEKLYLNPLFGRQTLIDRTGLSKERIGAAFSHGSEYERLTTLVRELRLNHAVRT